MDTNLSDVERSFQDAIRNASLTPPDRIIFDGRIHRFNSDDKRDQAGWYVAFSDEHPAGEFGCWRKGFQETWRYYRGQSPSGAERAKMALARKRAKDKRERELEQTRREAARHAADLWARTQAAQPNHPYLARKQIQPHGARIYKNQLVLPVVDFTGKLTSLQFISPNGNKQLLKGGLKQGCYIPVSGDSNNHSRIIICEGWATGCSLVEDETSALVIAAINAGNLAPVAVAARDFRPNAEIVIAGDDDRKTPGNPGYTKANEAALASNALVCFPKWPDGTPDHLTDFNDLAVCLAGGEA